MKPIDRPWPGTLLADEFQGKRVLVTGSSRGIGAAVARAFADLGADVALHGRSPSESLDALADRLSVAGRRVIALAGDFGRPDEVRDVVDRAVDALGGLDVLVNNAGTMLGRRPIGEIDEAFLDESVRLNVNAAVLACRHALPALVESRGTIVNTASISARTGGSPGSSVYSGAKAFIATFTRSLATELAPHGIRANAVSPGTIETDFHQRYSTPEKLAQTAARIPLRRLGTAEDCVGAYLFLASPALSGFVTGQVIEVNGGQFMG